MFPEYLTDKQRKHPDLKIWADVPMEQVQSPPSHIFSFLEADWQHQQYSFPFNQLDQRPVQVSNLAILEQNMEQFEQEQSQGREQILSDQKVVKKDNKLVNDTKNIPKNFGKGIINFIERNQKKIRNILGRIGINYGDFWKKVKIRKQTLTTISQLRDLWTDQRIGKAMRVISNLFFRKYALSYIFNSRITSLGVHIKYRQILWNVLHAPEQFDHIKKY